MLLESLTIPLTVSLTDSFLLIWRVVFFFWWLQSFLSKWFLKTKIMISSQLLPLQYTHIVNIVYDWLIDRKMIMMMTKAVNRVNHKENVWGNWCYTPWQMTTIWLKLVIKVTNSCMNVSHWRHQLFLMWNGKLWAFIHSRTPIPSVNCYAEWLHSHWTVIV